MYTTKAPKISRREKQVLQLLKQGNSRKMIASELELQNHTINSYFKRIYAKLCVNSATQAISEVQKRNILWKITPKIGLFS